MAQEDKELLLRDLCARLPYGVIAKYKSREKEGNIKITCGNIGYVTKLGNGWWKECKPYLRSMSSMTEEECKELGELPATIENVGETLPNVPYYIEVAVPEQIDWLNAHHFDYRGLISKCLAIEATEGMYTKEE